MEGGATIYVPRGSIEGILGREIQRRWREMQPPGRTPPQKGGVGTRLAALSPGESRGRVRTTIYFSKEVERFGPIPARIQVVIHF